MRASCQFSRPYAGGRGHKWAFVGRSVSLIMVLLQPLVTLQGRRLNAPSHTISAVFKSRHTGGGAPSIEMYTPNQPPGHLPRTFSAVPSVFELRESERSAIESGAYPLNTKLIHTRRGKHTTPVNVELSSRRSPSPPRSPLDPSSAKGGARPVQTPARLRGAPRASSAKSGSFSSRTSKKAPSPSSRPRSTSAPVHMRPPLTVVRERRPVAAATWPRARQPGLPLETGGRLRPITPYSAWGPYTPSWTPLESAGAVPQSPLGGFPLVGGVSPSGGSPSAASPSAALRETTRNISPVASLARRLASTHIMQPGAQSSASLASGSAAKRQPQPHQYWTEKDRWGELGHALPIRKSELEAGQQEVLYHVQHLREKLRQTTGIKEEQQTTGAGEATSFQTDDDLSLLQLGQPPPAGKEGALQAALARVLPQKQAYTVMAINGERMETRRGAFVKGESDFIECIMVNSFTSTNYIGKFYIVETPTQPTSILDLRLLYAAAEQQLMKEVAGNERLLTQTTAKNLRSLCLCVYFGVYKLVSRSPSGEEFGDSIVDKDYSFGSNKALMVLTKFLLTPVVGPSINALCSSELSEAALKFLLYRIVYTLSQLHGFGLSHRMLDSTTLLIDKATGLPTITQFASIAPLHTRDTCTRILLKTAPYASPELAVAGSQGASTCDVTEYEDSWSAGVLMYMLLCKGGHPWKLNEVATRIRSVMKEADAVPRFYRDYTALVRRDTFLGQECLRLGTPAPQLMSIIRLLLDPLLSSRWTVRRLFEQHPFFKVQDDD